MVSELPLPVDGRLDLALQLIQVRPQVLARRLDFGFYLTCFFVHSTFSLMLAMVAGARRAFFNVRRPARAERSPPTPTQSATTSAAAQSGIHADNPNIAASSRKSMASPPQAAPRVSRVTPERV